MQLDLEVRTKTKHHFKYYNSQQTVKQTKSWNSTSKLMGVKLQERKEGEGGSIWHIENCTCLLVSNLSGWYPMQLLLMTVCTYFPSNLDRRSYAWSIVLQKLTEVGLTRDNWSEQKKEINLVIVLTCQTALVVWVANNWKKPGFFPFWISLS